MGQPQQPEGAGAEEAATGTGTDSGTGAGTGATGASATRPPLRVGMVGYAFMGAAHSQGWRTAGRVFDLPLNPVLAAVCGRDADAVREAADRHGWASTETDWRTLVERDDIDLVDICTPGDSHAEIALAALAAGKHVLCEKPLANTVEEAEAMTRAAEEAGARGRLAMVGFNYRRVPATALARRMVAEGRIGRLRHLRVTYLQDWLVDPKAPLTWRLRKELAGSGALGDLGAHIVDLAQYLSGERIAGVSALTETFVRERPLPDGAARGLSAGSADGVTGEVTVDDAAVFTARLTSGALASFEATRYATGRKNALRIELNGERGSLAFDLERLNELSYHDGTEPGSTPASAASSSPNPSTPTSTPGGRRATDSATSTPSCTRHATSSTPSPRAAAPTPPSPTGCRCSASLRRWRRAPRRTPSTPRSPPEEAGSDMPRNFTLFTGQWADLPLEEVCRLARDFGYDGLELACWGDHFEVDKALADPSYVDSRHQLLDKYGLKCWAISNHLVGQAVCDAIIDERHQAILPARIWGDGDAEGVRQRAAAEIKDTARAAARFGVDTVIGFTGSAIWHLVAMFPPAPESVIERGYQDFADRWNPILDVFDAEGVRFAHEVHPSEIAYDYWTTQRALEAVDHRPAFGLNFDPSHFVWQDLDPVGFLWDFRDRIYHVDCKEARRRLDGRNGRLGSHLPWGDPRRGWDFVSAGHGDVPWEDVFRMLRSIDYRGPVSVEWEDAGMDRLQGAPEALTRLKAFDFEPPSASFDAAFNS